VCGREAVGDLSRSCGLLVRRSPLKDKTPIAITALDKAKILVDSQIYAWVAERGGDLPGAVARNLNAFHSDDFWRRD
jgi:hypothetical protein